MFILVVCVFCGIEDVLIISVKKLIFSRKSFIVSLMGLDGFNLVLVNLIYIIEKVGVKEMIKKLFNVLN